MIYYLDSIIGNDANPGTGTTVGLPWKTLNKITSSQYQFVSGDSVLLNRDQTFSGNVLLNYGSPSGITFDAYGTGAKPTLSGFQTITGWTSVGNGIYSAPITYSGATLNMLTIDGVSYAKGRFPKITDANGGYLKISGLATKKITGNLSGSTNYIGGQLVVRTEHYILDIATITAVSAITASSSTITYNTIANTPTVNYGFFIQNHINTLTQFGDWTYSAKTINVHFGGNNPSGYTVNVPIIDDLFRADSNNISVSNLNFIGANGNGFASTIDPQYGMSVNNCNFSLCGIGGIGTAGAVNIVIQNNIISDCNSAGIGLGYHNPGALVINNNVQNIGLFPGMGGGYTGIATSDAVIGMTCQYNYVKNTGYCGISYNGSGNTIQYNYVEGACKILDDGAGIYNISTPPNIVDHNIVINTLGTNYGTDQVGAAPAHGIYFDNGTSAFTVTNNIVINSAQAGIYYHGSNQAYASGNTLYNNGMSFWLDHDPLTPAITACTIVNNQMYAANTGQTCINYSSTITTGDDTTGIGIMDYNYYSNPSNENSIFYRSNFQGAWLYGLNAWKRAYLYGKLDYNSYGTPPNNNGVQILYNQTTGNTVVSLSGNTYCDFSGKLYTNNVTLSGYSGLLLFKIPAPLGSNISGRLVAIKTTN